MRVSLHVESRWLRLGCDGKSSQKCGTSGESKLELLTARSDGSHMSVVFSIQGWWKSLDWKWWVGTITIPPAPSSSPNIGKHPRWGERATWQPWSLYYSLFSQATGVAGLLHLHQTHRWRPLHVCRHLAQSHEKRLGAGHHVSNGPSLSSCGSWLRLNVLGTFFRSIS